MMLTKEGQAEVFTEHVPTFNHTYLLDNSIVMMKPSRITADHMELILFIGLQASGKSTFYRTHFATTHEHISMDLLQHNKKPRQRQLLLLEVALQAQKSAVVDNTSPTVEDRQLLIQLGHLYGATIIGYYFDANVRQCIERNKQRPGKARVPDVAIYVTAKKMVHPTYIEGFALLYNVSIGENGTFIVREWVEEEIIPPQ
jgi:predicted kinase